MEVETTSTTTGGTVHGPIHCVTLYLTVTFPSSLQSQVYKFRLEDLPPDPSSAESAAAVLAVQRYCSTWPLISDTYSLAPQWLRRRYGGKVAVVPAKVSGHTFSRDNVHMWLTVSL